MGNGLVAVGVAGVITASIGIYWFFFTPDGRQFYNNLTRWLYGKPPLLID